MCMRVYLKCLVSMSLKEITLVTFCASKFLIRTELPTLIWRREEERKRYLQRTQWFTLVTISHLHLHLGRKKERKKERERERETLVESTSEYISSFSVLSSLLSVNILSPAKSSIHVTLKYFCAINAIILKGFAKNKRVKITMHVLSCLFVCSLPFAN